jgi:hypothetical protein
MGRLRWCFSPTKYKAIDLLVTTPPRAKREGTKKAETQMNRIMLITQIFNPIYRCYFKET